MDFFEQSLSRLWFTRFKFLSHCILYCLKYSCVLNTPFFLFICFYSVLDVFCVSSSEFLTVIIVSFLFLPSQFYLHNHLSFIIYFHREKVEEGEIDDYRVVRFEVVPQSVGIDGRCDEQLKLM